MNHKSLIFYLILAIALLPVANALASCSAMESVASDSLSVSNIDAGNQTETANGDIATPEPDSNEFPSGDCCGVHGYGGCALLYSNTHPTESGTGPRFLPLSPSLKSLATAPDTRPPIAAL